MWVKCPDVGVSRCVLLYTIWVNSNDNDTDTDENKTEGKNKRRTGGRGGGGRTFGRTDGRTDERTGRVEPSRVGLIHLIDFERGTISVVRGL